MPQIHRFCSSSGGGSSSGCGSSSGSAVVAAWEQQQQQAAAVSSSTTEKIFPPRSDLLVGNTGWKHALETYQIAVTLRCCTPCFQEFLVLSWKLETGNFNKFPVSRWGWKQPTRGSKTGNFKSGKMSVYCRELRQVARRFFPNDKNCLNY